MIGLVLRFNLGCGLLGWHFDSITLVFGNNCVFWLYLLLVVFAVSCLIAGGLRGFVGDLLFSLVVAYDGYGVYCLSF